MKHHLVALSLVQIGVHLATIDFHALQCLAHLFHLLFGSTEDDHALQVTLFEDILDDAQFLSLMTNIGSLFNFLGWFAHRQFHLNGIFKQCPCQLVNLVRHSCREHNGLACFRQALGNGHDIFRKAHVQHAVGLIQYKEAHFAQVYVAQTHVTDEATRRCNHHVGTHAEAFQFLVVSVSVVSAIHSHAAYALQIIAKALHGLVYLLGKFARW